LGNIATPARRSALMLARQRTSPSVLNTRTRSPSAMPRTRASSGDSSRGTGPATSCPNVELIVRPDAGEISASGAAAVAGSGR